MKFSGKVWIACNDQITFWVSSEKPRDGATRGPVCCASHHSLLRAVTVRRGVCCVSRCCRYAVDNNNTTEQAGSDEPHRRPRGIRTVSIFYDSAPHPLCTCPCVRPQILLTRYLTKLTAATHFGTEMKALDFGVKRSKFKVTVEYNLLETAVCRRMHRVYSTSYVELEFQVVFKKPNKASTRTLP